MSACGNQFGSGLGGVKPVCCRMAGHTSRCTDVPFLVHLEKAKPKVADRIVRDSFNTRGASWGKTVDGTQARRNRQPRWTLKEGDGFYPAHHQTYKAKTGYVRIRSAHGILRNSPRRLVSCHAY